MKTKQCEFCKEEIGINKRRCPFCGSIVEKEAKKAENGETSYLNNEQYKQNINNCNMIFDKENKEVNYSPINYSHNSPVINENSKGKKPLSNIAKVLLSILTTIPGIGQFIGVITSIILISEDDTDKKSFGKVLLVTSVILFVFWGIFFILIVMIIIGLITTNPYT